MEATQEIFHCQICGRDIKAGKGKIAKHGYKIDYGQFTKSCDGAGYAPFEVSCERLEAYIEQVKIWVTNWTSELAALLKSPPATLTIMRRVSAWKELEEITYEKPEGFNANNLHGYKVTTYVGAYRSKKSGLEQNIKLATKDIEEMEARAAGWHKEHDEPALEVSQPEEETATALEEVTSQPETTPAALDVTSQELKTAPVEVGDIVRPNMLYAVGNPTWTRAKVIGLHFFDTVDGGWTIDIQYMRSNWENGGYPYQFELTPTKQYMMATWEVELVERAAPKTELALRLEEIEANKQEKIAALETSQPEETRGYNDGEKMAQCYTLPENSRSVDVPLQTMKERIHDCLAGAVLMYECRYWNAYKRGFFDELDRAAVAERELKMQKLDEWENAYGDIWQSPPSPKAETVIMAGAGNVVWSNELYQRFRLATLSLDARIEEARAAQRAMHKEISQEWINQNRELIIAIMDCQECGIGQFCAAHERKIEAIAPLPAAALEAPDRAISKTCVYVNEGGCKGIAEQVCPSCNRHFCKQCFEEVFLLLPGSRQRVCADCHYKAFAQPN